MKLRAIPNEIFPTVVSVVSVVSVGGAIETTMGPGNLSNETTVSLFRCFGVF
jgi:hypothetical protein